MIHQQSGKLLPLPSVVPVGPEPLQPLPMEPVIKYMPARDRVITVHLDRLGADLLHGTLKKCEIGHAHTKPPPHSPHNTFMG